MILICIQGTKDHIDRLQAQVQTLEASSTQAKEALVQSDSAASLSRTQAELARMRAELAESEHAVTQLQQQLEAEQAEVLMLRESQGGSNKAGDVISALEMQVDRDTLDFASFGFCTHWNTYIYYTMRSHSSVATCACPARAGANVYLSFNYHPHWVASLRPSGRMSLSHAAYPLFVDCCA